MNEIYKNTGFYNLVNYLCGNSALPPQTIENSSNPHSLADLIKYFPLIEIKELDV